ncbi:MAG: hypothetical protein ABF533_03700 [Acetobacter persici]
MTGVKAMRGVMVGVDREGLETDRLHCYPASHASLIQSVTNF